MKPLSAKELLRRATFPHYVNVSKRRNVLSSYKHLIQQCRKFFDPMVRTYLLDASYENYMAYKYVTYPRQIDALVQRAQQDTLLLQAANNRNSKAVESVLDRCFRKMFVFEMPTYTLHHKKRVAHNLLYNIVHLQCPRNDTDLEQHNRNMALARTIPMAQFDAKSSHLSRQDFIFYKFIHMLSSNKFTRGLNDRKLQYQIILPGTILGDKLPACREKNIVAKTYAALACDAPYPVDRRVLEYVDKRIADQSLDRFYRRRFSAIRRSFYTIDDEFNVIR